MKPFEKIQVSRKTLTAGYFQKSAQFAVVFWSAIIFINSEQ
jgi:hypothetical protein